MATTYPTIVYGTGSTIDTNPRTVSTDFNDGYQLVIGDGINNMPRTGTLEHPLIDQATATTLLTFLRANSTGQVVTIKNMMEDSSGSTTLNVRITNWSSRTDGITWTFTVNFREAFST